MKTITKILVFSVVYFISSLLIAQTSDHSLTISKVFGDEGEIYFTFKASDRSQLDRLTRIISIDHVSPDLVVKAYANRGEFDKFLYEGIEYQVLPHPGDVGYVKMMDHVDTRGTLDWDFYPTYDAYVDMLNQFAADHPSICQIVNFGTTNQGRALLAAHISDNVGINENEPEFLYTSSIHGDELTGYILMLRLIDSLLSSYGTDPRITDIVNNIDIYINPLANPDGTYAGGNNTVDGAHRGNAFFIDMNRNYPDPGCRSAPGRQPVADRNCGVHEFRRKPELCGQL